MNQTIGNTKKKQAVRHANDNILESIRGLGGGIAGSSADAGKNIARDVFSSLTGGAIYQELKPNQSVEFASNQKRETEVSMVRAQELHSARIREEQTRVVKQLEAVRQELKALAQSVKNLHQEITKAVLETPVAPGVYHVNFFELLQSYIRVLKEQVDDSRTWLAAWFTRRKKQGYWGMYKKHGTSFGLSGERTIATSAG